MIIKQKHCCGKFKSLWRGWCGRSYINVFGVKERRYMCEDCTVKLLLKLTLITGNLEEKK